MKKGNKVSVIFVVDSVDGSITHLSRQHLSKDGTPIDAASHRLTIYTNDPTIEVIVEPRTVEVGQKYRSVKGVHTFEILFVDKATAFMSYSSTVNPDARSWESIPNLLDETRYELVND